MIKATLPQTEEGRTTVTYNGKEYPARTLSTGDTVATLELEHLIMKDDEYVSKEAELVDIDITYYADEEEFNLPESELLKRIYQ